jgi:archaellum component FlaC
MKLTERKLRGIIREELLREGRRENLSKLDDIKSQIGRFRTDLSDQSWDGEFTRGEMEELERKFKDLNGTLEGIERILIEAG